ncbi:hypothetical protein DSLASN_01260 [Desulfoluna limicola]|uniref:Uncharacterized protein n=1 Tax=Desulfoluna limicola TaxID=2810562 RepID=A0ABN6F092_9BACT|nr:hypothetical protein [Desulfoluna limicola]BCS94494.1 hypothetical protein DSLASN_01260 [Desulfoluna limicola]
MYGLPHVLKTRADFENMHALAIAGGIPAAEAIRRWQALINGQTTYEFDRVLGSSEEPDGPEPGYRVMMSEQDGQQPERHQFRMVSNSGQLEILGYQEADVFTKIEELEAL